MADVDFERAPFIVIWEMTQACDLACLHCRASARPMRDQGELTTTEAMRLMDTVRDDFGHPLFVLTGGDPLKRDDTIRLVEYGRRIELRDRAPKLTGRCGACQWKDVCGGSFRVRAMQVHGDPWAEDPGCYLTDEECGLVPGSRIREPAW
jgi:MoaA/NifB/PqqE/SkfB family radical SAM enzyme